MTTINQVPRAILMRHDKGAGTFWFNDQWVAHSLENPAKQIAEGEFVVIRDKTGKHRWFRLLDVFNRTYIELHVAFKIKDLKGCIALGLEIVYKEHQPELIYDTSTPALQKLSDMLGDRESFILEVRS